MEGFNVYKDIQDRTHGEIYIGVVGRRAHHHDHRAQVYPGAGGRRAD